MSIILKDCKVVLNIFNNLQNIKFRNLTKYLNEDIKYNFSEVLGRIMFRLVNSKNTYNSLKNEIINIDIIMNKVHLKKEVYDILDEYNDCNVEDKIHQISNIFNDINRLSKVKYDVINYLKDKLNDEDNILKNYIDTDKLKDEIDEEEYSPTRIQQEINLLKETFNK